MKNMEEMKPKKLEYAENFAGIVFSLLLIRVVVLFFMRDTLSIDFITIAGLILAFLPYYSVKYYEYKRTSNMEDQFPNFLRELATSRSTGMTLPLAVRSATRLDFGHLSGEVKRMSHQISWGVPFEKALTSFSSRIPSRHIRRSTSIITEADRSGGNIGSILESAAGYSKMTKELEREKRGNLSSYTVIIYFSYFVFLGILVLLIGSLIEGMVGLSGMVEAQNVEEYRGVLFHMALLQAAFTGLVAGKVGEGSILDGLKHSGALVLVGYTTFRFMVL